MSIKKGDIYWVTIPKSETRGSEQYGRRPVLVVSRTELNAGKTFVGVPLTSKMHKGGGHRTSIPVREIIKEPGTEPAKPSVALTDQIRIMDQSRLEQRFGRLSDRALIAVIETGLANLFDIPTITGP